MRLFTNKLSIELKVNCIAMTPLEHQVHNRSD